MLRSPITSDTDLYYDTSCKESIAIHRDTVNRSSPGYRTTAPSMPLHPRPWRGMLGAVVLYAAVSYHKRYRPLLRHIM
ncbi:UNVERIFIED_CONTAM: hypothetical protein FKN15_034798 [Acipenser sinensis]